jgi:DNA primase
MIPEDVIAEIRSRVDIVAVIGQHVQLRKAGRNWKGLCPFHGEKTPSFNVAPDKGFFYCFGCQKKGDAFTFLMELEGKSFAEAAEQLAARAGIVITRQDESPEQRRARGERSAMLDVCKAAAEIFRGNLRDDKRGATARAYLESRGVGDAISERFMLGYAAAEWSNMFDSLRSRRMDLELAVKLGLIARRPSSSGYYDRFRDRLVCPVIVPGGDVVGFSARILPPSAPPTAPDPRGEAPKYINSPESLVYKKSRLLFGLSQARDGMAQKGRAVLVEGNFDVITFHQAGLVETVAPLGTALTAEQVETLRRSAQEVVICYDGDRAGRTATRAALELLVAADIPVRVVALPDGEDPDSLVRKHGGGRAAELVTRAIGGVEYFCFEVWGKARDSADAHARALDDAARLITKVANETKRDLIVGTLASAMKVDVQVVRKAVARQENQGRQQGHGGSGGAGAGSRAAYSGHPNAPHPSDRGGERSYQRGGERSSGWSGGRDGGGGRSSGWGGGHDGGGGRSSGRGGGWPRRCSAWRTSRSSRPPFVT